MIGVELTLPPVRYVQTGAPPDEKAYTLESVPPMNTFPLGPIAGELRAPERGTAFSQSTAALEALSACSLFESEPTYTTPFASAGLERTLFSKLFFHLTV